MEDEEERAEALLKETLAYIHALDEAIKADARTRGKLSAALSTNCNCALGRMRRNSVIEVIGNGRNGA